MRKLQANTFANCNITEMQDKLSQQFNYAGRMNGGFFCEIIRIDAMHVVLLAAIFFRAKPRCTTQMRKRCKENEGLFFLEENFKFPTKLCIQSESIRLMGDSLLLEM